MLTKKLRALSILLALVALLSACTPAVSQDTQSSAAGTIAPPPKPAPLSLYAKACQDALQAEHLVLNLQFSESRTVGDEVFHKSGSGTAQYENLGTPSMEALIQEKLSFGTYSTDYTQSYMDGKGYIQSTGASFFSTMTPEAFLGCQTPIVMFTPELYAQVNHAETSAGGYRYTFSQPTGYESWLIIHADAKLLSFDGWALVDEMGILRESHCEITYETDGVVCTLNVSSILSWPNMPALSTLQPEYPADAVELEAFLAPRLILQAVGNVYSAQSFTLKQTKTSYCEAATVVRTQSLDMDVSSAGDSLMARAHYIISLSDYTGTPTTSTQTEIFRDNTYHYTINQGSPVHQDSITAEKMRNYCEDTLLNTLLNLTNITGASVEDSGDFYCIQLTGRKSLADPVFTELFQLLNLNLDSFSSQITTQVPTAYLTISKHSGMPMTMGQSLTRYHVIDNVSYRTTFQVDQTVTLPSDTAQDTITGNTTQDTELAPEKKATPLFYKISDKKGRTLYLLGTIHVGDNRTGFLPQEIYDAFAASTSLAVEFDSIAFQQQITTDPLLQSQLSQAYFYSDGSKTADHLPAQLYEKAYALLLASGSNTMDVPSMRPIIWESMLGNFFLAQGSYLSPKKGMDSRLLALAREQKKTIVEVESGLSQVQVLSGLSETLQIMLLKETVSSSVSSYCQELESLYEIWCSGDAEALTQALKDDTASMTEEELALYNEYYKKVITNRNTNMLKAARNYIKSGKTTFLAVGAAHVVGEGGLVAQLKKAGYKIEQITYAEP